MKATAWIAAAALVCGSAAFAQQHNDKAARADDSPRAEQQDHASKGHGLRSGLHRLGEKTRHAMHRAGDKMRHLAHNDRSSDTRAMGAAGSDSGRQARMDEAYSHWKSKQDKAEHNTASSR